MRKGVIDVGSNSVLLLVEEFDGAAWRPVLEDTRVTALGAGTKQTGLLSETSVVATLRAVKQFFDAAHDIGAESVVAYGTMAVRIASNSPDFQRRAIDQGTPVSILSGDDEAQLGFESVAYDPAFSGWDRISIIDPGGQSTELTTADRIGGEWRIRFRRSFPIGTLALRGGTLASEVPTPGEFVKASAELDDIIGLDYLRGAAGHAVVLGATGTNLISIRERMTTWQPDLVHAQVLGFGEVSQFVGSLGCLTDAERAAVPGMETGRERTIHLGALILERFLNAIGAPEVSVSVRGWRHALLERGLPKG